MRDSWRHDGKKGIPGADHVFPGKPRLREDTYQGWGPWGRGGDSESNYLRNRVDPAVHARALSFRQFLGLDETR